MKRPQLFVKSNRTNVITGHVSVTSIGALYTTAEYAEGSVRAKLSPQDSYAKDLLRRAGVDFETVDLSSGIGSRLKARLKGVRQTPTLWDPVTSPRSYVGIEEISRYINANRFPTASRKS